MVRPVKADSATPVFQLSAVSFSYGRTPALDALSLDVQAGERLAILGANGSGKSTLLRLLDALIFPQAGSLRFCGQPLTEERLQDEKVVFDFRRRVGLIFQNPDVQLFNPTVFDEVAFGPLQLRWPHDEIRKRVSSALEELGITHLRSRAPHQLSGGEKKRVALASVLVLDPEVLLLDEPTANLDPSAQSYVIDCLIRWKGSKTIITATHNLDIIADIADRCLVLEKGRVAGNGSPEEILRDESLLRRTHLIYTHKHSHTHLTHSHLHAQHAHRHS